MNAAPFLWALAGGFAIVAALGFPTIALLRGLSLRAHAYEDAPSSHASKTGTPTMGGVLFAVVLAALGACAVLFDRASAATILEIAGLGLACGAIGFVDDYLGIARGRNRGLSARAKFALTIAAGVAFLVAVALSPVREATDALRFGAFSFAVPAWVWFALGLLALLSTTHAVNLTDGLDGLATGTIVAPLALFAWLGARAPATSGVGIADAAMVGAALGFLAYNRHPARVFMGDTGSLLLGGVLAGSAILLDQQLLLPLVGAVFAAEALSVIIQVAYFKRTRKRIFRMSPLHHHFELAGWPETTVTARFWLASLGLSLVGLALSLVRTGAA